VWLDLDRDGTQDANEPGLPEMSVQLTAAAPQAAERRPGAALLRAARPWMRAVAEQSTHTDASGDYAFWALAAADYRITVQRPAPLDVTWDSTGPADAVGEVVLPVGGEGTVDVGLVGDAGVQATVLDADGAPADGDAVLRWAGVDDEFSTDDDVLLHSLVSNGRLRIDGLPAGSYRVESVGSTASTELLDLAAGSTLTATVELAGDGVTSHPTPDTTTEPTPAATTDPTTDGTTPETNEPTSDLGADPASDPIVANDPVDPSTAESTAQPAAADQSQGTLPRTGGAPWPLASMGLLLVLSGVVLRRLSTRLGAANRA
jgi:hypothetical protein